VVVALSSALRFNAAGASMQRHLITVLVLLAALVCYRIGFGAGAFALVAAGGALELWFWVRLLRGKPRSASAPPAR
jgi:hypothetical protein